VREFSGAVFIWRYSHLWEFHPTKHLPKASPSNTTKLGARISIYKFKMEGHKYSIHNCCSEKETKKNF
jgi:hypothetical protein